MARRLGVGARGQPGREGGREGGREDPTRHGHNSHLRAPRTCASSTTPYTFAGPSVFTSDGLDLYRHFDEANAAEEANGRVADPVQDNQPTTTADPMADFGANEWLVDEMYERYQADPDSVDRAWWEFFRSRGNAAPSNGG